ncbi:MAG: CRP-like cAMP-binding protein [Bradymonadia bacterium]|jgi:CRP-like cAMP-binding protein
MDAALNLSLRTFFRNIPLFASLSGDELGELLRLAKPFVREAGDTLFSEGDPADGLYVVERGEVGVVTMSNGGDPVRLAELGNGAVIGELALIDGATRSATVEALAMTTGYWLSRARFDELRGSGSRAAYKVVLQCARTLESRRRVTELRLRALVESPDRSEQLRKRDVRQLFGVLRKA